MRMIKTAVDLGNFSEGSDDDYPYTCWYEAAGVVGTADEIRGPSWQFRDSVAGLYVEGVAQGSHDGKPAVALSFGKHGRMIVDPDAEIDWVRDFNRSDLADDTGDGWDRQQHFLKTVWAYENAPKVVTVPELDTVIDFDGSGETSDDFIAKIAMEFGVAMHLEQEYGPGGGNPVFSAVGARENVERLLRECYDMDDDDVRMYLAV